MFSRLISKLEETKEENLSQISNKVNVIFSSFEKRSSMNYQKATFLIGKELEDIKHLIGKFLRDQDKILKKNEDLIKRSDIISTIENILKELENIKKSRLEIQNNLENLKIRIKNLEDNIKEQKIRSKKFEETEEYLENERKKQDFQTAKKEIESKIRELKELIDFKTLANTFHSDKKQMQIIKDYRDNFKYIFEKDEGQGILELINEGDSRDIREKIGYILKKQEAIKNMKIDDETLKLQKTINCLKQDALSLEDQKLKEEKRIKRLEDEEDKMKQYAKRELKNINIELEL